MYVLKVFCKLNETAYRWGPTTYLVFLNGIEGSVRPFYGQGILLNDLD
jgi:hypothetical protein